MMIASVLQSPDSGATPLFGFDLTELVGRGVEIVLALVQALLILVIGWIIARIIRSIVVRGLRRTRIDRYLSSVLTKGRKKKLGSEKTIGRFVYGLLMLFVAIEVMRALGLTMITEPLVGLVARVVDFLPQVLAAGVLAVIAWGVARLARRMVRKLLESTSLDQRLEAAGEPAGGVRVRRALADASFYFVFLFFLPQILDALRMEGLQPVQEMVGGILTVVPKLLGAAVMLTIFYFVAKLVQRLTVPLLASLGVDRVPQILGFEGASGPRASVAAGWVVLSSMMVVGAMQAANTLGLILVAEILQGLLVGMFRILIAAGIFAIGLWVSRKLEATFSEWEKGRGGDGTPLATAAKVAVLVLTGAMALGQTGLAPEIIQLAVGALALGIAIAGGLAFGLGGREHASRWIGARRAGDSGDPAHR